MLNGYADKHRHPPRRTDPDIRDKLLGVEKNGVGWVSLAIIDRLYLSFSIADHKTEHAWVSKPSPTCSRIPPVRSCDLLEVAEMG